MKYTAQATDVAHFPRQMTKVISTAVGPDGHIGNLQVLGRDLFWLAIRQVIFAVVAFTGGTMPVTRSKSAKKRVTRKPLDPGLSLLLHANFCGVEQLGPTEAAKILYDKLRQAWELAQTRDQVIAASNYAVHYRLKEEARACSTLMHNVMDKIKRLGFNGAEPPKVFKHNMKLISDLLNKKERELSEELDARPKLDLTVEEIGCLGKARCGTLLRKMPMRLNVTPEQEEAIRARYASLEDDCA